MEDAVNVTKADIFRELFGNNLFRVLLVVIGADIGASIGWTSYNTQCNTSTDLIKYLDSENEYNITRSHKKTLTNLILDTLFN